MYTDSESSNDLVREATSTSIRNKKVIKENENSNENLNDVAKSVRVRSKENLRENKNQNGNNRSEEKEKNSKNQNNNSGDDEKATNKENKNKSDKGIEKRNSEAGEDYQLQEENKVIFKLLSSWYDLKRIKSFDLLQSIRLIFTDAAKEFS